MHNCPTTDHDPRNQSGIGYIAFDKFDAWIFLRQIAALSGGQVIENSHCVAFGEQSIGQMGANKTGTAGD
jgi:hypothetical protein